MTLFLGVTAISGQVDSIFWFAAPDFSDGHGDVPIYLRFTTLNQPATITLSQPANPAFQPITFNVSANDSYTQDLSSIKGLIENDIPNTVLNRGLRIQSTALINVYYENASHFNPEIFSLKGSKALGKRFLIPMQDLFPNGNYSPVPYSSFDIIATEDDTEITIIPTHDVVGHISGDTIRVTLNKGETYVTRAATTLPGLHLGGSLVYSDKPVAVTIKDDSMASSSIYGGCADLGGDQITPIKYLGNRYITVPGALNGPNDVVFIYATKDSTEVTINGSFQGEIHFGEFVSQFSFGQPMIIETNKPSYVLHMSGFGCEVGLDQLPPVDPCNGSRILAINRSSNQPFFVNILVYRDLTGSFLFNGRSDIITDSDFQEVPGSGGDWNYANILIPLNEFTVGTAALVQNTEGPFHLSVIHGGPGTGTMYGYFSDYGDIDFFPEVRVACHEGLRLQLDTGYLKYDWSTGDSTSYLEIDRTGRYMVTVTDAHGCVAADTIDVNVLPEARNEITEILCRGDSINIHGIWFHEGHRSGEIILPGVAESGCDSILSVNIFIHKIAIDTLSPEICPGDSIQVANEWFHKDHLSSTITLTDASFRGCDSVIVVESKLLSHTTSSIRQTLCPDDKFEIHGQTFDIDRPRGSIDLKGQNQFGCDSVIHVELEFYQEPIEIISPVICPGDSLFIENEFFHEGHRFDTLTLTGRSVHGCDSHLIVNLDFFPETVENLEMTICQEDTLRLHGIDFHFGHANDTILLENSNRFGCDSSIEVSIDFYPSPHQIINDTLCPGETMTVGNNEFNELRTSGEVRIKNGSQFGCDSLISVDLYYPQNDLSIQDTFHLRYGFTMELEPDYLLPFDHFEWSPADDLSCTHCENPLASPLESTTYFLSGMDIHGCLYETQTRILVQKERKVFIPNVITANGDRLNDGFTAFGNYFADRINRLEIY
ncbi:MAG: IgGFc-binding protein, partial [Saprospiraceae bacterium]|nr:IgGFc-binding protein [Saprospiraceae bacterium]